jgi:hypothetical protein
VTDLSRWLALRQAADFAARSASLTQSIASRLQHVHPLRILDLGTGTGSNIRYLASKLRVPQDWLAVDQDPRLLMEVVEWSAGVGPDVRVETRSMNLGEVNAPQIFERRHLVTASALLDLVSERWLRQIAGECRRVGACALFTISYNGRNECAPADPDDGRAFDLFNRHQLTDKGLGGAAVGPRATEVARRCFEDAGFEVRVEPSDWHIGPDAREFQRRLIEGWASAAAEIAPEESDLIDAWKERRLAHVAAGRSQIMVGHHDLAALPR